MGGGGGCSQQIYTVELETTNNLAFNGEESAICFVILPWSACMCRW